jgi:thioesterase domain-containing protein/acyl carrier protein
MTGQAAPRVTPASGPGDPRLYQVDDEFRRVLADLSFLARVSRVTKTRFFHPKATDADGELTVLDQLTIPQHDFFTPGRRFDVVARCGNATVSDDAAPDLRGISLRLYEPGSAGADSGGAASAPGDGLLDLTMNTGECFFASNAVNFQQFAAGGDIRDALFEREPRRLAVVWDAIRRPVSYLGYDYYSQAPRCFVAADGTMWLVRFRLRASEEHPDQGEYDPGLRRYPPDPPDLLPRDSGDTRPPTFMHDELVARLAGPGVDSVLQLQLHPVTGTPLDEIALDSSLPWPEREYRWHDVARLRLTGLADGALAEGLRFNAANGPESLGIAIATSPHESASLNHARALVYQLASLARTGQPMPPELAGLLSVQSPARASSAAPHAPVSPAPAPVPTATPPAPPSPAASVPVSPGPAAVGTERPPGPRTVCVVGAGPAGLIAARELERAGHRAIVLEARPGVGGKCDSVQIEGRAFDLGGHLCTVAYERVAALAAELGVPTEATTQHLVYDTATKTSAPQDGTFFRRETYQRYAALRAAQFAQIAGPGLAHSARALAAPAAQWLAEHGLQSLATSLGTGYTAAGYGYLAGDLPALYFVKYVEMTGLLSNKPSLLGHAGSFTMAGGFVRLWEAVAALLSDVRCGVRIDRIERDHAGVRVHTGDGVVVADDLVLTVPVSQVLPVLDATATERDLASRVRTLDYQTTIATVVGLPRSAFYLSRQATDAAMEAARRGHCVSFHHRYPERDIYACYSYGDDCPADTDPEARLARDIERFGGRLGQVHLHREWAFLPHFGSADLAGGIYDRIEDLQGHTRTYHAGSLPAFELVECVIGYAQELVRRHFPPVAGTATSQAASLAAPAALPAPAAPRVVAGEAGAVDIWPSTLAVRTGAEDITEWLVKHIAVEARLPETEVDPARPLEDFALDSLSIAALGSELSDWLGFRVPHALFLSAPTIGAMAAQLADASTPEAGQPVAGARDLPGLLPDGVLPLTSHQPFFCLGGAVGTVHYLRTLAQAIGHGQACYGLQAPGLSGDDEPAEDVGELAAHGLRLLRRVQPRGPYLLGGHSFGGLVAYEMGRVLHDRGERAHVMLLDTFVPVPGQLPPPEDEFASITELLAMHRLMHREQPQELAIHPDQPPEMQYEVLGRALGATGARPVEEFLANLIRVYQGNLVATVRYQPPPSAVPVTLFKASGGFPPVLDGDRVIELRVDDQANGWNTTDVPGLRTVTVPGDHFSMLAPPHVDELATALRDTLREALADTA